MLIVNHWETNWWDRWLLSASRSQCCPNSMPRAVPNFSHYLKLLTKNLGSLAHFLQIRTYALALVGFCIPRLLKIYFLHNSLACTYSWKKIKKDKFMLAANQTNLTGIDYRLCRTFFIIMSLTLLNNNFTRFLVYGEHGVEYIATNNADINNCIISIYYTFCYRK